MSAKALKLASTKEMSRAEWLSIRGEGIGSSDAAAAIGICKYKSPLELWLEKTKRKPVADLSANEAVFWGTTLEHIIANVYGHRTGAKVRRLNAVLQHPTHKFMLANLDRVVQHPTDGAGILEVKTAGTYSAHLWDQSIPENYQCQVLHQLAVTGKAWCDVAVLIGGQDFRIYRVLRDEQKIEVLIEREHAFWQQVLNDTPPDVDGSESSGLALETMFPRDTGETIDMRLDSDFNRLFEDYWAHRQQRVFHEEAEELFKQRLQQRMGDYSVALLANAQISWRKSKDGTALDLKQLSKDHPEVVSTYSVSKPGTRRFMVNFNQQTM